MTSLIAALPMYDWPEVRAETDAQWARLRDALRDVGVDAPDALTRDVADLQALWRNPQLLLSQTCWGPMELGLADHVQLVGQPSYDGIEGGQGIFYSSALVMRRGEGALQTPTGQPILPLDLMAGKRLAFNSPDSMSGIIGLARDLAAAVKNLDLFSARIETGGHRASVIAVAEGHADIAAIDCRSWSLAKKFEPAAAGLQAVGWTAARKGLPYIASQAMSVDTVEVLRSVMESQLN
ncbi:PhnD/SsuA/transferrin family substrate-binding protein [Mesorhizobium sp. NBSH29]|uniref:phosphate/phosphite/phosphonate ABC transporter substrate-binding protein n=1 Tax=Mesorhizobium sp. NBSH29 TaxID=2654249 RepID=UPI0018969DB9|nr:PhnD/SsuA/transferrin family substrate-binding protein [Mesorhizobium sp. NBSH29]QPC88079.1 PhnD/SsuA/transferrin family substrate-binding protein [Mesorhizobium sp. NBSH29]